MQIVCRQVIDPTPEVVNNIVDALEVGNADYRYHRLSCDGDPVLMRNQLECYVKAALIECELWTASCGQSDIGCVAIWVPPGKSLREGPEQEKIFDRLEKDFKPELKAWKEKEMGRLRAAKNTSVKIDKFRDWHLSVISTVPSMRRRGLASALIKVVKDRVDHEGGTISLTTQTWTNADKVYKPFGFEVVFADTVRYINGESDPYIAMKYESP